MEIIKAFDELPKIVKIIFALPFLDIIWAVYRIIKGACTNNTTTLVAGIVWVIFGCFITWVLDLVYLIMDKQPLFTE